MTSLPVPRRKCDESRANTVVELGAGSFDAVVCTPPGSASKGRVRREVEEHRQVGNETPRGQRVGAPHFILREAASSYLVRVRREEEPVQQDKLATAQRGADDVRHELRARRHEQERFGALVQLAGRIEQQSPDLVAGRGATRLAKQRRNQTTSFQETTEMPQLSRLSDSFDSFEDNQAAGHRLTQRNDRTCRAALDA